MRTPTTLLRTALVALALGATSVAPAGAAPGDPLACGDTVTGAAVLTADLTCPGPGLLLTPGSSLDLQGHTLTGPGTDVDATGLYAELAGDDSAAPVTVRNGTVRGWAAGLRLEFGAGGTVEDMTFRDNVSGFAADSVQSVAVARSRFLDNSTGMSAFFTLGTTIDRSMFRGNGTGVSVAPGGGMQITDSTFTRNGTASVCSEAGLDVSGSVFTRNTVATSSMWCGLMLDGNAFRDNETGVLTQMVFPEGPHQGSFPNTLVGNEFARNGLAVDIRESTELVDNTFTRNDTGVLSTTFTHEALVVSMVSLDGNRFDRNGDAVYIDSDALVKDTRATRGTGYGIYTPRATDLGGNVAWGNAVEPQCTGVVCAGTGS
jgi:hypothetical protein